MFAPNSALLLRTLLPALLLLGLLVGGCEELALNEPQDQADPLTNFDAMWTTLDARYTYWDLKGLNRDSLYSRYRSQAAGVTSRQELFEVLEGLLNSLRDGHTNLYAEFDFTRYWEPFETGPENYNEGVLIRNYWGDYRRAGGLVYTLLVVNNQPVGYIRIASFGEGPGAFALDNALLSFRAAGARKLVVDLRHNGGGNLDNALRLLSRFVEQPTLIAENRYKASAAPNDFTVAERFSVEPNENVVWADPVAVLTNRRCYSATNFAVYGLSRLPQVTTVGDSTSGGGGFPLSRELPNGWIYRFSGSRMTGPDGWELELPLPPDIRQDNDPFEQAAGRDQILERALQALTS